MVRWAKFVLLIFIVPFCWNLAFMIWCQQIKDSRSLIEVSIPESTKAFLDSIGTRIIDGFDNVVLVEVDSIDDNSWTNITDYGYESSDSLYKYESDSLFVFYSDVNDTTLFKYVQASAMEAVSPLAELMGHYVYPYQVKGRKLPIYICSIDESYQNVCHTLSGINSDFTDTWGLHIYTYCGLELQTTGIVLNKSNIYETSDDPDLDLKATLWHEMNHYVFFQSLDLSKEITPYVWMYEGLAEYFSSKIKEQTTDLSVQQKQDIINNTLVSTFEPFLCNYFGGEIFYNYTENLYGIQNMKEMIQLFYKMQLVDAFANMGKELSVEERQWKDFTNKKY